MKTIVVDLDGTLLNSKHEVDEETKNYLINKQKEGHKLILCSGRSYTGMESIAELLKLDMYGGYVISYNGGEAREYSTKKKLFTNNFTKETVSEINKLIGDYTQNFVTYSDGKIHSVTENAMVEHSAFLMKAEIDHNIIVESPKVVLQDEVSKITNIYDDVKHIINEYDDSLNVFRSVKHLIEITPFGSDKGYGIKKLIELKPELDREIIAFGDGENDITMLKFADIGVAMENAMQTVKKISDFETGTNDNQGIVRALEKILGE